MSRAPQIEERPAPPGVDASPNGVAAEPAALPPPWERFWRRFVRSVQTRAKWLRVGMRVKRWLAVVVAGIVLLVAGIDLLFLMQLADLGDELNALMYDVFGVYITDPALSFGTYQLIIGVPLATLGLLVTTYGVLNMLVSVHSALAPDVSADQMADAVWRRRQLAQGYRIAVIGGGTGLATLLRGLKAYSSNLTAVVTVTDDGGSSGRLLTEFAIPPPGDIRNCLVALADAEPLMEQLFQHRFANGGGSLDGHSFGNLLIAAMTHVTGDFEQAVRATSRVLNIRGRVVPSTLSRVSLIADFADGETVEGETRISARDTPIRRMRLSEPDVAPLPETLEALRTADAIIIGPGSVYTSVAPNFLVRGIAGAVAASDALKIYVCNVMTQRGETSGFSAADHVKAVIDQAGAPIFDYVLVNNCRPSEELLERYGRVGAEWVEPDVAAIRSLGLRPVEADLINETEVVRHDSEKLAAAVIELVKDRARLMWWTAERRR